VSTASDLRQRLLKLRSRLDVLLERRQQASREHSFARARQDAGVTPLGADPPFGADEIGQLARDETAGDAEITDIRREIRSVDDELERDHGRGLRARATRVRLRRR
jgi:hypothetical protein